jgi:hypothetical protein
MERTEVEVELSQIQQMTFDGRLDVNMYTYLTCWYLEKRIMVGTSIVLSCIVFQR